jgi:membrane protease YdiL (CAAX protease family)
MSESLIPEANSESPPPPRSLLAPPGGMNDTVKSIFWNATELRAGWRFSLYVVLVRGFLLAAPFVRRVLHVPRPSGNGITPPGILIGEVMGLFAAVGAALLLAWLERRHFGVFGLPGKSAFGGRFWQGIAWGIVMVTAVIALIRILGGYSLGDLALHGGAVWNYALLWGLVFVTVGLFEEFLFRGYTQFTLTSGIGFWPAATVLSALFGAGHLGNGGEGPVGALSVFVIGMFFCLTLRRTGDLWFAVGLHASFDWGETYLYSVPNSGLTAGGHLLNSSFHGPAWITGGTVGPEGSAMAFVVMALAAMIFSRVYPPREAEDKSWPIAADNKPA